MAEFLITAIVDGMTYSESVKSRKVQLDGELLIVGNGSNVSDTMARVFSAIAELRADIEETE